ncbi:phosphoglycerate mutase-like protein [Basidiobolus meristosporus CBS 931.73]|uniref:Phosphoglycerate mutase-like protein n=1 Tax=Basidiobolus meristosporus CBS 931.73 TaxID=1314790 RepID=A0A1Y1XZB2_9FUNG|nr:phosphoglycerate mutase-like protein [Basidiobolus meristosporus CBS 931.73]|eukprot:ORX90704.1 phosphoglycerate mutase-like protein [Basidiobolus meristosporus CBS 931.73]
MTKFYSKLSIVVARHGETEYNKPPVRLQGQLDVPLNDTGKLQARALGGRLSTEEFDVVYCSDLSRTKQTLEPLLEVKPNTRVVYEPRLRERDVGSLTDMLWSEAKTTIDEAGKTFEEYVALSGESAEQFYSRVCEFWDTLVKTYLTNDKQEDGDELRVLIITHGGVIANLMKYLKKQLHYENTNPQAERQISKNTAVYKIQVDRGAGSILLNNCTAHLDVQPSEHYSAKLLSDFAQKMNYY